MRTLKDIHKKALKRHPDLHEGPMHEQVEEMLHQLSIISDKDYEERMSSPFPPVQAAKGELQMMALAFELEEQGRGVFMFPLNENTRH